MYSIFFKTTERTFHTHSTLYVPSRSDISSLRKKEEERNAQTRTHVEPHTHTQTHRYTHRHTEIFSQAFSGVGLGFRPRTSTVRLVWSIRRLAYVYRSAVHDCIRVALGVLIANVRLFFFVSSYSLSVRVLCRKSRDNDESCRRALTEGKSRSKTPLLDMKEYSCRKSCCLLEYFFMSSK